MTRTIGIALTIAFLLASLTGTVGSGWLLSEIITPTTSSPLVAFSSTAGYMIGLALLAEALRFVLSAHGETIWRRSRFQGAAFVGPLWLACTAYCTIVPLLTLAVVYVTTPTALAILAAAWLFIQIGAGLLPGLAWPRTADSATAEVAVAEQPAQALLARADPAPKAATAEEFFQVLSRMAELPEGSSLANRGRVAANREIVISQGALANLIGRSKPTVRRWLQHLESSQRIAKSATGKQTRIRLLPHLHAVNGELQH
jgi:hypothetical protein